MKRKEDTSLSPNERTKRRKARSLEAREAQLAALAYDLVEQRLLNGTATSQETTCILRMASSKEKRDARMDELEMKLKEAKIKSIESSIQMEELYKEAIAAVQSYSSPLTRMPQQDHHD